MKYYKEKSKKRDGAPTSEVQLTRDGEIVVGKFVDRDRPDYFSLMRAQFEASLGDRYQEPEMHACGESSCELEQSEIDGGTICE